MNINGYFIIGLRIRPFIEEIGFITGVVKSKKVNYLLY